MATTEKTAVAIRVALEGILEAAELIRPSRYYEQFAIGTSTRVLTRGELTFCRRIMPLADGTLDVIDRDGNAQSLTVKESVAEDIEATQILGNTGACKVYW